MQDFVSVGPDGRFRSSKMERLAEIFEDYDPELEVQWIPPEYRTNDHSPEYRLVHNSGQGTYVIGTFRESDKPEEVYARFLLGDTRKRNTLREIEAMDLAEMTFRMKEWHDSMEERKSMAAFMMSDRSYIRMRDHKGDLVAYDENRKKRYIGEPRGY